MIIRDALEADLPAMGLAWRIAKFDASERDLVILGRHV
jgi:hypothetical protein